MSATPQTTVQPGDVIADLRRQLGEAQFELALANAARADMARRHEAELAKLLEEKREFVNRKAGRKSANDLAKALKEA